MSSRCHQNQKYSNLTKPFVCTIPAKFCDVIRDDVKKDFQDGPRLDSPSTHFFHRGDCDVNINTIQTLFQKFYSNF